MKHLVLPDKQIKDGVDMSHLLNIGRLIVDEKPDRIIDLGDHFDMPSLSSYDKGRKTAEGRRVHHDLMAGWGAMGILFGDMIEYNQKRATNKKKQYKPDMHFCLGNHEHRLYRHIEANAELDGILDYPGGFKLENWGWKVHEFRKPVTLDGVSYAHYFYNVNSGTPYGGTCHTKLRNIGHSFVQGHQQGLDLATRTTNLGETQWGITAGSCYTHEEEYRGPQAQEHWRGVLLLDNAEEGNFEPRPISLKSLEKKYGNPPGR